MSEPQRGSSTPLWMVAWLLMLAVFIVMAGLAAAFDRVPGDEALTDAFQSLDVPALGGYLAFVNALGTGWFHVPFTIAVAVVFARERQYGAALLTLATYIPRGLHFVVKDAVDRPRPSPELVEVMADIPTSSFPSGHTVGTAALFGLLFFLVPAIVPWRAARWLAQGLCALFVVSAGPARVYEGVHWPSDVIGGYLLAALFVLPAVVVYRWRGRGAPAA